MWGECQGDALQNWLGLGQHLVVPEADDAISATLKPLRSLSIVFYLLGMLSTVDLDDQPGSMGDKIHDVWAHGLLAAEFLAGEPAGAEVFPQASLGVGHVPTKLTCEVTGHHAPSPGPNTVE